MVLLAAGRPWARALLRQGPISAVPLTATGRSLAPLVAALGLVGLAGAVAILATRGVGRLVTGALLALAGFGVVVTTVHVGLDLPAAMRPAAARISGVPSAGAEGIRMTAWSLISGIGGALLCGAGVLTALRGRRWAVLSGRYEAADADRTVVLDEPHEVWDALDRGQDPTR